MPAITVTEPGDTLGQFTAGAVSALQDFTLSGRANALIQCVGSQDWQVSSDNVNWYDVPSQVPMLLPILSGSGQTRGWYFRRAGGVDSTISVMVAG